MKDKGEEGIGRVPLGMLAHASGDALLSFIQDRVALNSTIRTDEWGGYNKLGSSDYRHIPIHKNGLKVAHLIASLLKRWLLETHQGAVSPEHLACYLDEYTFRFNRRTSTHRGKLFMRLLENAVKVDPVPHALIIRHVRKRGNKDYNL
jgi:transposase-like protein